MSLKRLHVFFLTSICMIVCGCKKDDRPLVVSKIQAVAKLATTQVTIDKYIFATKEKKLLGIFRINEAYYAARTEATVKLGIDLNKINRDDISVQEKSVSITLPPIEVLSFSYPFESFQTDHYVTKDALFNKIDPYDIEEYYRQGEMDIRNNLDYMGLIEKTQSNTRSMLRMMLAGLGYQEIYIDFKKQDKLVGATIETEPK